ncbi:hypothetical protein [Gilliamella apicola]|jgi:hypothetical protein|uniref:hypothetical protein n=1 Tax=Gilliamella apicola TaxID=1196095 RepID=UPI000A341FF0|nr:hypothetical protein [Gilliamella apicola]OTQ30310.1 hypothetical protein B6D03_02380 [Gilliamella apicola]
MIKLILLFLSILSCLRSSAYASYIKDNIEELCQALTNLKLDNAKIVNTEIITDRFSPSSKSADTLRGAKVIEIGDLPQFAMSN